MIDTFRTSNVDNLFELSTRQMAQLDFVRPIRASGHNLQYNSKMKADLAYPVRSSKVTLCYKYPPYRQKKGERKGTGS